MRNLVLQIKGLGNQRLVTILKKYRTRPGKP
jgi:hypothetical protein